MRAEYANGNGGYYGTINITNCASTGAISGGGGYYAGHYAGGITGGGGTGYYAKCRNSLYTSNCLFYWKDWMVVVIIIYAGDYAGGIAGGRFQVKIWNIMAT